MAGDEDEADARVKALEQKLRTQVLQTALAGMDQLADAVAGQGDHARQPLTEGQIRALEASVRLALAPNVTQLLTGDVLLMPIAGPEAHRAACLNMLQERLPGVSVITSPIETCPSMVVLRPSLRPSLRPRDPLWIDINEEIPSEPAVIRREARDPPEWSLPRSGPGLTQAARYGGGANGAGTTWSSTLPPGTTQASGGLYYNGPAVVSLLQSPDGDTLQIGDGGMEIELGSAQGMADALREMVRDMDWGVGLPEEPVVDWGTELDGGDRG